LVPFQDKRSLSRISFTNLRGVNSFQGKQRFPRIFEEDSLRQRRIGICYANLLKPRFIIT